MVEDLLTFKQGVDEVVSKCFNSSDLFLNVLKECFEAFVNIRQNKPAELVAKYLDLRLRSGNKVNSWVHSSFAHMTLFLACCRRMI